MSSTYTTSNANNDKSQLNQTQLDNFLKTTDHIQSIEVDCLVSNLPIISPHKYAGDRFINSSPYPDHPLDLTRLDESSKELAILLQELRSNEGYLDLPCNQAFNWSTILSKLSHNFPARNFYLVVFHATLAPSSMNSEVIVEVQEKIKATHAEANLSGGLLKFWSNIPGADRRLLALCLWTNTDCALTATKLPQHVKGMEIMSRGVYESWVVKRFNLKVGGGTTWTIEEFI